MDSEYIESIKQKIVSQLEEVYDPEIPINQIIILPYFIFS